MTAIDDIRKPLTSIIEKKNRALKTCLKKNKQ